MFLNGYESACRHIVAESKNSGNRQFAVEQLIHALVSVLKGTAAVNNMAVWKYQTGIFHGFSASHNPLEAGTYGLGLGRNQSDVFMPETHKIIGSVISGCHIVHMHGRKVPV